MNYPLLKFRTLQLPALTAAILMSGALSAPAEKQIPQVPFHAAFSTMAESWVEFPIASVHVVGQGRASHLGLAWTETTDQQVNLLTGEGTATYRFRAANGDELDAAFAFTTTPIPMQPGITLSGTWAIVGGTGRFATVSGSGTASGTVYFTSETLGTGQFSMVGTISPPR